MLAHVRRLAAVLAILAAGSLGFGTKPVTAQQNADLFKSVVFRDIGPTRQGQRFVDFGVVESSPRTFYAVAATGGVFKTTNNGQTFTQIFDNQPVASLGANGV